jgi:predicted dehydrogenase
MDTIRSGFVGLGGICQQRHVPGLERIEGIEIRAVANRSRESSDAAAREYRIPIVCDSWKELIQRDDIDAVFIGTWPYMHHPISIAALEAGKHVFCQARMAMNLDEAKEMLAVARRSGLVAMLCPVPFGLSIDRTIARLLDQDALGKVTYVRVQSLSGANADPDAPLHWRKDRRLSGLNVLTLGMYAEVLQRWFGPTRSVAAQSQIYTTHRRDQGDMLVEVKVPDQVLFHLLFDNGAVAQGVIGGMSPNGSDWIEIHGTSGALLYDVNNDLLYHLRGNALEIVEIHPDDAYDVRHWRVERDFIDAIREGREYHPDFLDGVRYMQVVQAVHDSAAQNGCAIPLENIE